MPKLLDIIGKNLRNERKIVGLSQQALAEKAGISYKYLGEIERGQVSLSVEILMKISEALDVEAGKLLSEQEDHRPKPVRQGQHILNQMSEEQAQLALEILKSVAGYDVTRR